MPEPIAVISAKRTPIGAMLGDLSTISSPQLGAVAIAAALESSGLSPIQIDEVIMGCVLSAGVGQAPARQAALAAGLNTSTCCSTVNKVCGSGMNAVMSACNSLRSGQAEIIIAGGMENMSQAPHLLPQARMGYRYGERPLLDHMQIDGLQDAFKSQSMGQFAEQCAAKYNFSRADQDAFALASLNRAKSAIEQGLFKQEIAPVSLTHKKQTRLIEHDQQPLSANPEKIPTLPAAFVKDGTITAANASSISDGAAALVMMSAAKAKDRSLKPIALIHQYDQAAHQPEWFTTAPVAAIEKTLQRVGWKVEDVDLWEINEAFAVVPMAAMYDLGIAHNKVNINGGACALGHPIGASGARIIVSLIYALRQTNGSRGIASLCIGGGEATAVALELI
ncbi:acetyl-CoA C-acyltransferase [Porticoccaceae bacterium]|jgi:acetyl-CoA C-acetyltransferase|nr:acetyl-CoA C-acyltransferase [Porticoccaceae bacterium]